MSLLFYKRPKRVRTGDGPLSECTETKTNAQDCNKTAIPPELSFERVICNKCLAPCSLQDFLDYLLYVTHDAENLQFYLWMVDYCQRFRHAPKSEKVLLPKWKSDHPMCSANKLNIDKSLASTIVRDIDMYSEDISSRTACEETHWEPAEKNRLTMSSLEVSVSPIEHRAGNQDAESQNSPETQPFRAEIKKIIAHYITPGSPRQLNLSHNDRATVLRALKYTTHPSALTPIRRALDSTLRKSSHPNFVRWSICNGNKPWTYALRIFAITNIVLGFGIAIALTLSRYSRWWRIFAALEWWFGTTNIIAASQGLCVLLHRLHRRQNHAWETKDSAPDDDEAMLKGWEVGFINYESTQSRWPVKMEVFGPANNYSDEPWVDNYTRKGRLRKLFEKRVSVHDAGLKAIQNRMIRQAELWALLITIPLTVAFVAIPKGNFYPP